MQKIITTDDWLLLPVYLGIILFVAAMYRGNFKDEHDRKYLMWGLYAKLAGGLAFALIYEYHYGGGDTSSYWYSAKSLINLAGEDFHAFWKLMGGSMDIKYFSAFTADTGYTFYMYDAQAFAVSRFMVPFVFLGAKSFLLSTLVFSFFMYSIVFRFYRFVTRVYPGQRNIAA